MVIYEVSNNDHCGARFDPLLSFGKAVPKNNPPSKNDTNICNRTCFLAWRVEREEKMAVISARRGFRKFEKMCFEECLKICNRLRASDFTYQVAKCSKIYY